MGRSSLSAKTLLLAGLNLVVLAAVFFMFARVEFRFDLQSYFLHSADEKIAAASRSLALALPSTPKERWDSLLKQYSARYPAQLFLFQDDGRQLGGPAIKLPEQVLKTLRNSPFEHERWERRVRERESALAPPGPPPPGARFAPNPVPPPEAQRPPIGIRPDFVRMRRFPDFTLPIMHVDNAYWAGVRIPIYDESGRNPIHAAVIWQMHKFWTEPFFVDYRPWLILMLSVVLVSAACWIPPIRSLTRSIRSLTYVTGQIAHGHFEIVLPVDRQDELGYLSDSINSMAKRLSGYVSGQKRFLGDIAHELSSPIARIQVGLSILEQRVGESDSDVDYVLGVREEVEHMSNLVNELLAFTKSQLNSKGQGLTAVPLNEVVDRVIAREATEDGVLTLEGNLALKVLGTPESLFRALANVVRNALRYAGQSGPITIRARSEDEHVSVLVEDNGPGLPEAELENVFRPFYRPEFARQRETGGTGLGLAIVRDCVEACGGTVRIRNRTPEGLQVEIRLLRA
jgi:two-component system, OmpR family, sensor histidine kinase CpxA